MRPSQNKELLAKKHPFSILEKMSFLEIKKMSVHERLTVMEQLWDSLCHEESFPESPSWHQDVLDERKKRMDSPDAKYLTIEELRQRYR